MNTLIYSMGDEADDILRSFSLSVEEQKSYATVKAKFDSHFTKRRNVIFERARFNMRRQEEGEPVDAFITALYSLAEHCGYGALHDEMIRDEMIRDRIVVGIRNAQQAEKLQLDSDLTLEKAVTQVRQAETIKLQQPLLRSGSGAKLVSRASRIFLYFRWEEREGEKNTSGHSLVPSRPRPPAENVWWFDLSFLSQRRVQGAQ